MKRKYHGGKQHHIDKRFDGKTPAMTQKTVYKYGNVDHKHPYSRRQIPFAVGKQNVKYGGYAQRAAHHRIRGQQKYFQRQRAGKACEKNIQKLFGVVPEYRFAAYGGVLIRAHLVL